MDLDGSTAVIDLQYLLALDWAADMETAFGSKWQAAEFRDKADKLRTNIKQIYWDTGRQMFADTPAKRDFSQQANSLAVLARVIEGNEARALVNRILKDSTLTEASFYFRHYLHTAVNQVGEGDRYLDMLDAWDKMLANGLTTWAEKPEPTRSDCHAWSASPNYELFRTVLGIDSAAPGFKKVLIRPYLGKLQKVSGAIPHPNGEIEVKLWLNQGKCVNGEFVWRGKSSPLQPGLNKLSL
jgi:alpha-L-rhamnosidase